MSLEDFSIVLENVRATFRRLPHDVIDKNRERLRIVIDKVQFSKSCANSLRILTRLIERGALDLPLQLRHSSLRKCLHLLRTNTGGYQNKKMDVKIKLLTFLRPF
eukprot:gnl/TRDRNA2_/TRDRNA2_127844_c0_seq3.p1 gnl/TRDRNA2_/TRDRNA2_127844_c0~~gnl/TRDRNA2_/TRDRNA2_127844_c0_seq3.p1  ORF type:complete len:105 (-),score=1.26 gnl/TRDRNA2_/TRDRNA2_127844_c0_seq3:19-333(-)